MAETLSFRKLHSYDMRQIGISVRVTLRSDSRVVDCDAKVDTGASFCIFERAQGEVLGLDIEAGVPERVSTARGEQFTTYGHEVALSVLGIEVTSTVYFAADENFSRNVLGRQGWLDRVRLGLVDYEGKLYLSDYNDSD